MSYFEINVSQNGQHVFATAPRSITSRDDLGHVLPSIRNGFPAELGYHLTVTRWDSAGYNIDPKDWPEPVAEPLHLQLQRFGKKVLEIMERAPEWGPDTLDAIAFEAMELGLAERNDDCMFVEKKPKASDGHEEHVRLHREARARDGRAIYEASFKKAIEDQEPKSEPKISPWDPMTRPGHGGLAQVRQLINRAKWFLGMIEKENATAVTTNVACSHAACSVIFLGSPGDLCPTCSAAPMGSPDGSFCNGCSDLEAP